MSKLKRGNVKADNDCTPNNDAQIRQISEPKFRTIIEKILKIELVSVIDNFIVDYNIKTVNVNEKAEQFKQIFEQKFNILFVQIFDGNFEKFLEILRPGEKERENALRFFNEIKSEYESLLSNNFPKATELQKIVTDFLSFYLVNMQMSFFLCYQFDILNIFDDSFDFHKRKGHFNELVEKKEDVIKSIVKNTKNTKNENANKKINQESDKIIRNKVQFEVSELAQKEQLIKIVNKKILQIPDVTSFDWKVCPNDDNRLLMFNGFNRSIHNDVKVDKITQQNLIQQLDHIRF